MGAIRHTATEEKADMKYEARHKLTDKELEKFLPPYQKMVLLRKRGYEWAGCYESMGRNYDVSFDSGDLTFGDDELDGTTYALFIGQKPMFEGGSFVLSDKFGEDMVADGIIGTPCFEHEVSVLDSTYDFLHEIGVMSGFEYYYKFVKIC